MFGKGYELAQGAHKQSFISRFWKKVYSKTGYLYSSRTTAYGLLLILPLLAAYEFLAIKLNDNSHYQIRNLADILLKETIALFGIKGPAYLGIFIGVIVILALFLRKRNVAPFRISFYFMAILEGAFYAVLFGTIASRVVNVLLAMTSSSPNLQMNVMLSLGAGVYEELIFRVLFFKFTAETLLRVIGSTKLAAYLVAAIFSSALFSYAHFLGPEFPAFYPFVYRFIIGIFFCVVFWARGLGISVWSHALYDLFILFNGQ